MPMDPRLWSEGPIRSSFPACMAVKAAAEQGPEAADRYLRARPRGAHVPPAQARHRGAARGGGSRGAGLDVSRFRVDLDSNAIVEAFGADLEETRSEGAALPSIRFRRPRRRRRWVSGAAPYEEWRAAAIAAGAEPSGEPRPDPLAALRRFGRLATVEVEAVCDLSNQAAEAELWRLAAEWRVRPVRVLTGCSVGAGLGSGWARSPASLRPDEPLRRQLHHAGVGP